jgi:hypothetical protein
MKHFDDLTKIDVPFHELDEDTRKRLQSGFHTYKKVRGLEVWYKPKATPMTRQQVLEKYNVLVTEEKSKIPAVLFPNRFG